MRRRLTTRKCRLHPIRASCPLLTGGVQRSLANYVAKANRTADRYSSKQIPSEGSVLFCCACFKGLVSCVFAMGGSAVLLDTARPGCWGVLTIPWQTLVRFCSTGCCGAQTRVATVALLCDVVAEQPGQSIPEFSTLPTERSATHAPDPAARLPTAFPCFVGWYIRTWFMGTKYQRLGLQAEEISHYFYGN